MDIQRLKEYIAENALIPDVLEGLGCHKISIKSSFVSAANSDGDNPTAIQVYKDNLHTIDYTRDIKKDKSNCDLIDLVCFVQKCNFIEAVKWICDTIGISVYQDFDSELSETAQVAQMLLKMLESDEETESNKPLKPIPESILTYYDNCVVKPFLDDNISAETQQEFQVGYDQFSNRITIPIRDEYGTLVGVKGRWFGDVSEGISKYIYLEKCNKGHILFGLYRALPYIKRLGCVYVVESEKAVMQAVSMGFDNTVACGGKQMSSFQIEMLSRLCADIYLCFDQDVQIEELNTLADRFIGQPNVYALVDDKGLLKEKESPTDREDVWGKMIEECVARLR